MLRIFPMILIAVAAYNFLVFGSARWDSTTSPPCWKAACH